MSDVLRGDTAALRAAQPGVEVLRDQFDSAVHRLTAVLDAEGSCWGHDEAGHRFGDAYRPAEREVRAAFAAASARLGDIGAALLTVADVLDAADGHARHRFP